MMSTSRKAKMVQIDLGSPQPFIVHLIPEEDGRWSVIAATLPGISSQGDSIPEALDNVKEAIMAVSEQYREDGRQPPYRKECEIPTGGYRGTVYVLMVNK